MQSAARTLYDPAAEAWEAAARVARDYFTRHCAPVKTITRLDKIPYAFDVQAVVAMQGRLLVHQGRVVEERGVGALAAYLRDIGFLHRRQLQTDAVLAVASLLRALPTGDTNYIFFPARPDFAELNPRMYWQEDRADLVLYYHDDPPFVQRGEWRLRLVERVLAIPADYALAWRERPCETYLR